MTLTRHRTFFQFLLVLPGSLILMLAMTGSAAAETDVYSGVAFHSFTLDGNNNTCIPWTDSDIGQTRNCDPVNLIFPGRTWMEVRDLLQSQGWSTSGLGSGQWLHYDGPDVYPEDEQLYKSDVNNTRYHIRLWHAPGNTLVTFAAVHHESGILFHTIDMDWEQVEADLGDQLCAPDCEQTGPLTEQIRIQGGDEEWRGWANNGSATVIPAPASPDVPPTVNIVNPADAGTVSGLVAVRIQAGDDTDAAGMLVVEWNIDGGAWQPTTYNTGTGYYEDSWNSTTVADGSYIFNTRAMDSTNNTTGVSNNIAVDNLNDPPQTGDGSTLGRPEDPIIVPGTKLPALIGRPVDELVLFTFEADSWSPIPFQIDERADDITGTYVIFEDGLLDANDELVFMAGDTGQLAGDNWPEDAEARQNPRARIAASDPLSPGDMGWAYLFRSTTLSTSATSYVDWDETLQTVTTISYTAAFSPSAFVGLSDLTIHGNDVDILDRQKIRLRSSIITLDEEDLTAFLTPTVSIPVVGPVRGVTNGGDFNVSIYGARLEALVTFDTSLSPLPIEEIRTSLDLNDPALTSITNYYDSNGTAATIDGTDDTVTASPVLNWYQASGVPGGLVVAFPAVNAGGGTVTNYYKDNGAIDPSDTGDLRSYGDTGLLVSNPGSSVDLSLVAYVLPLGTLDNVGEDYFQRISNPLSATTAIQFFGSNQLYLPVILRPS